MKKKTLAILLVLTLLLTTVLTGCGKEEIEKPAETKIDEEQVEEKADETQTSYPLIITDASGREVELEKKPEKVTVISATLLSSYCAVGGEVIGISDDGAKREDVPEDVKVLPTVGPVYNIDMEKLMSLEPDFIIAQKGIHDRYIPMFEQSGIPFIVLAMKTYEDTMETIGVLGDITGNQQKAQEIIDENKTKIDEVVGKLPEENKKVAILYVTSEDVSVKLENSIAGDVSNILKLDNMSKGVKPAKMGSETVPFSMERIVEYDPDVILVTTMVSSKEIAEERIKKDVESNPAWSELRAIKEGNIKYLPQDMFLQNAGQNYWKAIEYMAKAVYPEVYGDVED